MNDPYLEEKAYKSRENSWNTLEEFLPDIERMLVFGPQSEEDYDLLRGILMVVMGDLLMRRAKRDGKQDN